VWRCPSDTAVFTHAFVAEFTIGFGRTVVAERMSEMHVGYENTRNVVGIPLATMMSLCFLLGGCSSLSGSTSAPLDAPIKVVVGPVILESPLPKSTQIQSFSDDPSPELEPVIMAQLVDELQTKAQQILTEQLAHQRGLIVVPFDETRRMLADIASAGRSLTAEQIDALASQSGADVVITGLIHDYGKVRWQYWVAGWVAHVAIFTAVIGVTTGWNPAAIGAYLVFDATTDFPIWYGGAQVFGWAFRPVRVHLEAVQIRNCRGVVWSKDELAVKVPGKTLAEYPQEEQSKLEIQLEANLKHLMAEFAETIAPKLVLQPCQADGSPATISSFSIWSVFDLLY
jgi:hypothetical protein